jgi:iron complex transport system substrate-binding protein
MAESLGIPVVIVSTELEDAPEVYRFLGKLLGLEERAEQLALYAEETFNDIAGVTIPDEEKVRIYYGNGEDSLETAPAGSSHGQIIDMVNGLNAADLELGDGSRVQISLEQLLAWNPDVIIVNGEPKISMTGGDAAESILNGEEFATIKAVQNGNVFGTPNAPFSWIERPPGPNRIVGMRWLAKLVYPDYFDYDVDEEVKKFFSLFYHVELDADRLEEIYSGDRSKDKTVGLCPTPRKGFALDPYGFVWIECLVSKRAYCTFVLGGLTMPSPSSTVTPFWLVHVALIFTFLSSFSNISTVAVTVSPK